MALQSRSFEEVHRGIQAFDLEDVKRSYTQKYGLTEEQTNVHERELKRYLTLCALNPGKSYGMFSNIDMLWHEFICFTPKYARFCDAFVGHYLHHVPAGSDDAVSADHSQGPSSRQNTISDYERHFGPMDPEIWRITSDPSADDCCTICTSDKKIRPEPVEV